MNGRRVDGRAAGVTDPVLVADDDADVRVFLEITLELAGYAVVTAADGQEAVELAVRHQPALILLDVMMPRLDGIEVLRRLRRDGRTSHIPVILVTARAQGGDKLVGFEAGADDYVTKPFDATELTARVEATLRRATQMRTFSPLTGLPGNTRIEQELERRIRAGETFALLYADLNRFKAYNDHYGFLRGDAVIRGLASVIRGAAIELGGPDTFVGHVGGDDFVVLTAADRSRTTARAICERFDELAPTFYEPDDLAQGFIEVRDRRGATTRVPLVSVSVGIADNTRRRFSHPSEPVVLATEMKAYAKGVGGSNWAVDRRAGGGAG